MRRFEVAVRNLESRGEPVCSPLFRRVRPYFGVFAPVSACSPLLRIRALYRAIQTQRVLTYLAPR